MSNQKKRHMKLRGIYYWSATSAASMNELKNAICLQLTFGYLDCRCVTNVRENILLGESVNGATRNIYRPLLQCTVSVKNIIQ